MATAAKPRAGTEPEGSFESAGRETMRRASILDAARTLFQRYGYKKTTMDDIARAAGITKPTVYSYFAGKKEILTALVEWEASRVLDAGLSGTKEDSGVVGQLAAMFSATDAFLKEDNFLQGIVSRDPDVLTPEVIRVAFDFERKIIDAVAVILERGMKEGAFRETDPKLMAYAIVRLHEAFTFSAFFELEGYSRDRINEFFVEMMIASLRPAG